LLRGWANDLVDAFLGVKPVFLFQGDTDTIQDAINKGARILGAEPFPDIYCFINGDLGRNIVAMK
jgi:hypothetical protein